MLLMEKALFVLTAAGILAACNNSRPTEVLVLPTIHGVHNQNPNYSFEDLFDIINQYNPQVIGIEIRPEDMNKNNEYLDPFYPAEMMMARDSFPDRAVGIDFYGDEYRGRLLSPEVFEDTTTALGRFVYVQRQMNSDSILLQEKQKAGINEMLEEQVRMVETYSANELMSGEYDDLTAKFYRVLDSLLLNSSYEYFSVFNNQRDLEITKNALEIVKANEGKKILFLVGANHRNRLVDSLEGMADVRLVEDLKKITPANTAD